MRTQRLVWAVGVTAALVAGVLVAPAIAGSLGVTVSLGPSQQVALPSGTGAILSLAFRGGLSGCWAPYSQRVEVEACLGAQAGVLSGQGTHVDNPASGQTWWFGVHAGGAVRHGTGEQHGGLFQAHGRGT